MKMLKHKQILIELDILLLANHFQSTISWSIVRTCLSDISFNFPSTGNQLAGGVKYVLLHQI